METTIQWLWRITKSHFNNKPNKDINIEFRHNLHIMTFNIRRDIAKDDKNNWQYRKEAIVEMIKQTAPDIICMQEVMPHMAKYLKSQLSKYYDCKGLECFTGREITKSFCVLGEGLLTFYRKDRFDFIDKQKIKLFDGRKINLRRALVTRLYDRFEYRQIDVVNTHFCYMSNEARNKSFIKLWQRYCKTYNQIEDIFICGDFNCQSFNKESGINLFTRNFSYNDFDKNVGFGTINYFRNKTKKVIDFIFSNKSIKSSRIIDSEFNNVKFISDHYPVINIY